MGVTLDWFGVETFPWGVVQPPLEIKKKKKKKIKISFGGTTPQGQEGG
jgi:hypothetical protein